MSVEAATPFLGSETVVGLRVAVRPDGLAAREIVPVKLLSLVTLMSDVWDLPCMIVRDEGFAEMA